MKKVKLTIAGLAIFLVVIIVFQNVESVATRILFIKITMPRSLLLLVTMLLGFVIGIIFGGSITNRFKKT